MQLQAFSKNSTTSRLPVRANWEGVVVRYLARRGASGHRPLSGVIGHRPRGATAPGHRPLSAIIGQRARATTASGHRPLSGVIGQRLRGTAATGHRPRSATSYRSRRVVCGGSFGHRPHSARVSASSTGHRPRTFGDGSTRLTSAAAPSPRDLMNWIGNLPGWEPIYYPDGFRPSRPWVNPFMRVLGWETSWGDRHTARMSEVEALSRAQRIVTGEGAGRLWLDFAMDLLYLERSRLYQQYWPQASHLR